MKSMRILIMFSRRNMKREVHAMKNIISAYIALVALASLSLNGVAQASQSSDITMNGLDTGLMLYYPFSTNDGAIVRDASGNGQHGTMVNSKWRPAGPQGGYCYFDGNGDYIDVGYGVNFPAWSQYSISLWFLSDGGGDNTGYGQKLLDKTSVNHDAHLRMTPSVPGDNGYISYSLYEAGHGTGVGSYPAHQVRGDNLWHHIVLVRNGSSATCWFDGKQEGNVNNAMSVNSAAPLYIGFSASSDSYQRRYWSGFIDEVRIYNRVISSNEVSQLFQATNTWCKFTIENARGPATPDNGAYSYLYGTTVSASVPPHLIEQDTRYVSLGASISGNSFTLSGTTNVTLTITNDAVLVWNWQTEHKLTTETSGNGSVLGGGWYPAETVVFLVASPDAGFQFTGWSDGELSNSRSVVVPKGGASFTATFAPIPRGVLRFQQSAYSVTESADMVVLKVERAQGSYGAATVTFASDDGGATSGEDYMVDPYTLTWNDGQTGTKSIFIELLDDDSYEGNETFTVRLIDATGAALDEPDEAQVTIVENEGTPSRVPRFSGHLDFGEVATNTTATRIIEVWNDGNQPLSVTNVMVPAGFSVTQQVFSVPAGDAVPLTVRFAPEELTTYSGLLTLGCIATSGTVSLAISGTGVPPVHSAGIRTITGFTAIIAIDVPEGAELLGVEDVLSQGLIPVEISDGGTWDAVNRKVKWFFNQPGHVRDRALQYRVGSLGNVVTGRVNFSSVDLAVTGDTTFTSDGNPGLLHPADDNGDWRVVLNEVSSDVNRWKNGIDNQKTPVVVRGIMLYLQGEQYAYDPQVSSEAKRWIPMIAPASMGIAANAPLTVPSWEPQGDAVRSIQTTNVTVTVAPKTGTIAWGMEESLPEGVNVSDISNDGAWDANHRRIKWTFFDGNARTLSYSVYGQSGINVTVTGTVSFDGSEDPVTGASVLAVPLPFSTWANRQGLAGETETIFHAHNAAYGQPNGLVYAFQPNVMPGDHFIDIVWRDGLPLIETPTQDPSTLSFVDVSLEWTANLTSPDWSVGPVPAADQTGVPANRCRWVPLSVPNNAFYRLRATLK